MCDSYIIDKRKKKSEMEEMIAKVSVEYSHPFTFLSDVKREYRLREKVAIEILPGKRNQFLNFLRFIRAEDKNSLSGLGKVFSNKTVHFVSACCFNAEEDRKSLVSKLSSEILGLIGEITEIVFRGIKIKWDILTFSPGDLEFMDEYGITETILPYILKLPLAERKTELRKQWELTEDFVSVLPKGIYLRILPLKSLAEADSVNLLIEAEKRGEIMFEKLLKNPPAIFRSLGSEKEIIARCKKEAITYLLMTRKYAPLRAAYLGLEVHGGYWRAGGLNHFNGYSLPLTWFHPVLCQHWGQWAEKKKKSRLESYKKFLEDYGSKFKPIIL